MIKIKRGLDLPISGVPEPVVYRQTEPKTVALLGADYVGMKPTMLVTVGDKVKLGQVLFTDKKCPSIKYTSPGSGEVIAINRGDKRVFQNIVIRLEGNEEEQFSSFKKHDPRNASRDYVKNLLLDSGLWTSLRTRPYSKVADPTTSPSAIFITAIDTNPLSVAPAIVINDNKTHFEDGLYAISKLTDGPVYLCKAPNTSIPGENFKFLKVEEFSGPHPAGNVGTHIHYLHPVGPKRTVWHVGYQDIIAIGKLMTTGKLTVEKIISLAGPGVLKPRLLKTRIGACINDITQNEIKNGNFRLISGSVLSGRISTEPLNYLGRYHLQISVIEEEQKREFLGWQSPGFNKFSIKKVFASAFLPQKKWSFTTSKNGSLRSMVPIGSYEQVMPLDILPNQLLRSLLVRDTETAQQLGCLELDEEDLSLCTFVCTSKIEYGPVLRQNLNLIEKEG